MPVQCFRIEAMAEPEVTVLGEKADVRRGAQIFQAKCAECHTIRKDDPAVKHGPTFAGLYGRKAGSLPGFKYSDVMRTSEMVWDEATLMSYLARPNTVTSHPMLMSKSAKLVFRDVRRRDVRRDLVGYLKAASTQ